MVLYFVLFGVKMAFYSKIHVRKSPVTRDVLKKIKGYSAKENGRKYSVKLRLSDITGIIYIEKKRNLFSRILYIFLI